MLFPFVFYSVIEFMVTMIFMLLNLSKIIFMLINILSFTTFVLANKDKKVEYDKIFKIIEPISILYGTIFLFFTSVFSWFIVIDDVFTNPIYSISVIIFLAFNWLGIINYFILRFFPLTKFKPIILKLCCYSILITIIVNIVFTITDLMGSYSFATFIPISVSLLYFKTLLIAKDNL